MPALTRFYGLPPREWEEMTLDEIDTHLDYWHEYQREQERQRREYEREMQ